MEHKEIITVIQSTLFVLYLTYITIRFGWLDSISKSFYKLEDDGYQFRLFLFLLGAPMFALELGWFFFSGVLLAATGVAAQYKENHVSTVHYIGASGSIFFANMGLAVQGIYFPAICIIVGTIGFAVLKISNRTFWVETIAFVSIQIGIYNL